MAPHDLVFQLTGTCNSYPWGKVGRSSLAARLCAQTPPGPESESDKFAIDDDMPYSEMWFGDYPDFPARRRDTGEALGDVLARHGETLLGRRVVEEFGGQLPFLPKVGLFSSLLFSLLGYIGPCNRCRYPGNADELTLHPTNA